MPLTSPPTLEPLETIDFWNVNVPPDRQTAECPSYLKHCFKDPKERRTIATPDSQYQRQTWAEVKEICRARRPDLFIRVPSELRRYREFCANIVTQYGSLLDFIMHKRLRWTDLEPKGKPFKLPEDYTILYNDWPYGVDIRIVHLVVWTKFPLPDNATGDNLDPETLRQIEKFVQKTFVNVCGEEKVAWFKNWSSIKSVHAVEHFHVMLLDPDPGFVELITNHDKPLSQVLHDGNLRL